MNPNGLKILLVEDNAADAYLLQKFLTTVKTIQITHVERLDAALECFNTQAFDAVLLDLSLPDSRGLQTVQAVHQAQPQTPILVLTGLDDEETAIAALREGAQDYLLKGELQRTWLLRAIHYAIERQQNLDNLQNLNRELRQTNQQLEQFAHVVSHDLQQPLQVILGFSQLLVGNSPQTSDPQAKHYLNQIIKTSQRMAMLIQDLLNFSKLGNIEPCREPIDCNLILQDVLADLRTIIQKTQAFIHVDPLPVVQVQESHLRQLFQNLLSNALKYHPPDRAPQIQIDATASEQEWLFRVHDNGIGIEAEYFDQIFQIFQRLHSSQEYPGTGIGLATCKKIVERHQGRIWVESEVAVGTTVCFTLPRIAEPQ